MICLAYVGFFVGMGTSVIIKIPIIRLQNPPSIYPGVSYSFGGGSSNRQDSGLWIRQLGFESLAAS